MKKALMAAGIMALLLWCAGCSLNDNTAGPSATATPSASVSSPSISPSAEDTASSDASPSNTDSPDASASGEPADTHTADASASPSFTPPVVDNNKNNNNDKETDYPALGETLMKSEGIGSVKFNMSESDLAKALGQPDDKSDPETWSADGLKHTDWSYTDKGLIVDLVESAKSKTYAVYSIRAMDPCSLKTKRGVAIGDTKEDVLKAYDKEYNEAESDDGTLVLGSRYGGIIITLDEDKVVEIFIGATAE